MTDSDQLRRVEVVAMAMATPLLLVELLDMTVRERAEALSLAETLATLGLQLTRRSSASEPLLWELGSQQQLTEARLE